MPKNTSPKLRLDLLLVERRLVESRSLAQRLVMAGQVRVDDQVVLKPSIQVAPDAQVSVEQGAPFVSRGGEKLAAALEQYALSVENKICADIGASTGGFTDCLLQHGAERVYTIDVGQGILHWKLRQDRRVIVMEGTNARYVTQLPEEVDFVTIDASFISLKTLLPVIKGWFGKAGGQVIALVKPQFEAGRQLASRGDGVIRDADVRQQILADVLDFARQEGFEVVGVIPSPLLGPKGNAEFLAWLNIARK
jgi:23S rRNA (cytidine1920-2'-O)/16S rRNA (cytidine1409-2'-O)-methyltransferase